MNFPMKTMPGFFFCENKSNCASRISVFLVEFVFPNVLWVFSTFPLSVLVVSVWAVAHVVFQGRRNEKCPFFMVNTVL